MATAGIRIIANASYCRVPKECCDKCYRCAELGRENDGLIPVLRHVYTTGRDFEPLGLQVVILGVNIKRRIQVAKHPSAAHHDLSDAMLFLPQGISNCCIHCQHCPKCQSNDPHLCLVNECILCGIKPKAAEFACWKLPGSLQVSLRGFFSCLLLAVHSFHLRRVCPII